MSVSGDHPVDRDRITKLVSNVESVMPSLAGCAPENRLHLEPPACTA